MRRARRSPNLLRRLYTLVFASSRSGRAFEVVLWSNGLASVALGGGAYHLTRSGPLAAVVALVAFVLLRLALVHPLALWSAASLGTLAVAGAAGSLAWLFAHVSDAPAAPAIAGVVAAVAAATVPAWAYARLAERRSESPDSLVEDAMIVSSRALEDSVPSSWD